MTKRARHLGAIASSGINSAFDDGAGAYLDYDGALKARVGASGLGTGSTGFAIRTFNAGVSLDALTFEGDGTATFASDVTIETLHLTTLDFAGTLGIEEIATTGDVTVGGGLGVTGATSLAGDLGESLDQH